ncbi:hypothetical protein V8C26DRAFT_402981 [Trichoderma gracile]
MFVLSYPWPFRFSHDDGHRSPGFNVPLRARRRDGAASTSCRLVAAFASSLKRQATHPPMTLEEFRSFFVVCSISSISFAYWTWSSKELPLFPCPHLSHLSLLFLLFLLLPFLFPGSQGVLACTIVVDPLNLRTPRACIL